MNWIDMTIGFAFGTLAGLVFFAGLGLSVRLATNTAKPSRILLSSAALRISLLLLSGWAVAQIGVASLVSFAVAFVVIRFAAVACVHASLDREAG